MTTVRVTYSGPAFAVSALAQMLEQEGVRVSYTPPVETRGAAEVAQDVIVNLACDATFLAIVEGVRRFRGSRFGKASRVAIEGESEDHNE